MSNNRRKPKHATQQQIVDFYTINKIVDDYGCWLYPRNHSTDGYQLTTVNGKNIRVSRIMLADSLNIALSELKGDALHTCHRGHKGCYNPEHLMVGDDTLNNEHTRYLNKYSSPKYVWCMDINNNITKFISIRAARRFHNGSPKHLTGTAIRIFHNVAWSLTELTPNCVSWPQNKVTSGIQLCAIPFEHNSSILIFDNSRHAARNGFSEATRCANNKGRSKRHPRLHKKYIWFKVHYNF